MNNNVITLAIVIFAIAIVAILFIFLFKKAMSLILSKSNLEVDEKFHKLSKILSDSVLKVSEMNNNSNISNIKHVVEFLSKSSASSSDEFKKQLAVINNNQNSYLSEMMKVVNERLEQNNKDAGDTFEKISEKITIFSQAQEKMDNLSGSILSLETILSDKQARGAFGEVQLEKIIKDIFSDYQYSMQYKLKTGARVDCAINMPNNLILSVDSKFPLESFRNIYSESLMGKDKDKASKQFKVDLKKHIDAISSKYVVNGETSDYAIMFLPSESVFLEVCNNHMDITSYSQSKKVAIVSPSTLVSVLLTTHALLKDELMQKQISKVKDLVVSLLKDSERLEDRLNGVNGKFKQSKDELDLVNISFNKMISKINKIKNIDV